MKMFRCPDCGGLNRVADERLGQGPVCGRCRAALDLSAHPQDVSDDALERVVRGASVPVLVDFWASWCGPCLRMAPVLEAVARDHAGELLVLKVDVDQHKRVAGQLRVQGIPALAIWKGGELVDRKSGALPPAALRAFVRPHLG